MCTNWTRISAFLQPLSRLLSAASSAVDSTTSSAEPEVDEPMLHAVGLSSSSEHSQSAYADAQPVQSSDNSTRNVVDTTGFRIDNPWPSDFIQLRLQIII